MNRLTLMMATALAAVIPATAPAKAPVATADYSVGAQYDTTHVYVAPEDFDSFIASFTATFGGTTSQNAADVETLVAPHAEGDRQAAIVRFPGGYFAEIHAPAGR